MKGAAESAGVEVVIATLVGDLFEESHQLIFLAGMPGAADALVGLAGSGLAPEGCPDRDPARIGDGGVEVDLDHGLELAHRIVPSAVEYFETASFEC